MQVTGYQLREALRRQTARRDVAYTRLANAWRAFPDETKQPLALVEEAWQADVAVAHVQYVQQEYNGWVDLDLTNADVGLRVMEDEGAKIPLALGIKLLAFWGQMAKVWKNALMGEKPDRYSYRSDERNADTIVARPVLSDAELEYGADTWARRASLLRAAIAVANAQSVDLDIPAEMLK